jgi:flagellar basal body-associated protein FliL
MSVAISARESSRKANENLQKRLQEVKHIIVEERKQAYHG